MGRIEVELGNVRVEGFGRAKLVHLKLLAAEDGRMGICKDLNEFRGFRV